MDDLFVVDAPFEPDYVYVEDDEHLAVPLKRKKQECPASGCHFTGGPRKLRGHWAEVHHPQVLLWLCPVGTCPYGARKESTMTTHWEKRHKLSFEKIKALEDLPSLVQLVDNRKYRNPGSGVTPLTAPETEPWGALGHNARGSIQLEVRRALATRVTAPRVLQSQQDHRPSMLSVPAPAQTPLRLVAKEDDTPVGPTPFTARRISSATSAQASLHSAPTCIVDGTPVDPAPLAVPQTYSVPPAQAPLRSGSPNIVEDAEVTEPPITLSAEDPAIVAITRMTGPTGVLLRSLDSSVERLQKLRREVQEDVLEAHKQEIARNEEELNLLHRRVSYLEKQLKKAEQVNGNGAHPTTVSHLQRISSTRAYILFPNVGQTAVYSLTSADLDILD